MDGTVSGAAAAARIAAFFEAFSPADLDRLEAVYTPDAYFKDPFHEVRGLAEVRRIYARMFEALEQPRFVVTDQIAAEGQCFLAWEFHFAWRGRPQQVRGSSHLRLAADGRIAWHRDYWDAAEEVYEKLPLLGALMRLLKRRAGAG